MTEAICHDWSRLWCGSSPSFWSPCFQRIYPFPGVAPHAVQNEAAVFKLPTAGFPLKKTTFPLLPEPVASSFQISLMKCLWHSAPPTHMSHRRPRLQGSPATERNLSHLRGCAISWLSARVPLQWPAGPVRCLAGHVMLSGPLAEADSSPEKDALSLQSTIHQKHVSSFFLLTFWNPLWGSPTKLSKFVLRVGLLQAVIEMDSAWLTKKPRQKDEHISPSVSAQQNVKLGFVRRAYTDRLLALKQVSFSKSI